MAKQFKSKTNPKKRKAVDLSTPCAKAKRDNVQNPVAISSDNSDSDFFDCLEKNFAPLESAPTTPSEPYRDYLDVGDCVGIGGYFEPPADPKTPTIVREETPPLPIRPRFQLYQSATAKYKRKRQFFLGHVIAINTNDGACTYSVYFLFGKTVDGVKETDMKAYDGTYTSRSGMLGCDFHEEGDEDFPEGSFRVRQILHDKNEYRCVRLTGGTTSEQGQVVNFDMGYVIKTYEHQKQDDRIRGLGEIMTSRTRSRSRK